METAQTIENVEIDLDIPDRLHLALAAEASRRGVTLSDVIILLLEEGVKAG